MATFRDENGVLHRTSDGGQQLDFDDNMNLIPLNNGAGCQVIDITNRRGILLESSGKSWKDVLWDDGETEDNVPSWRLGFIRD